MDALISHFAEQMRRRKDGTDAIENVADDGKFFFGFLCENCVGSYEGRS